MAKAKTCDICMTPAIREELRRMLEEDGSAPVISITGSKNPISLDDIPDCPDGAMVGCAGSSSTKSKSTRTPSAYNLFVKDCMGRSDIKRKPQPERMGTCAAEWKEKKASLDVLGLMV